MVRDDGYRYNMHKFLVLTVGLLIPTKTRLEGRTTAILARKKLELLN